MVTKTKKPIAHGAVDLLIHVLDRLQLAGFRHRARRNEGREGLASTALVSSVGGGKLHVRLGLPNLIWKWRMNNQRFYGRKRIAYVATCRSGNSRRPFSVVIAGIC